MRQSITLVALASLAVVGCEPKQPSAASLGVSAPLVTKCQTAATETRSTGAPVMAPLTLPSTTPVANLSEKPATYDGKTVQVEGTVVQICQHKGCFIALADGHGNFVNLKVVDGDLDFREIAKTGQYALGEGTFSKSGPHGAQVQITGAKIGPACS